MDIQLCKEKKNLSIKNTENKLFTTLFSKPASSSDNKILETI